MNVERTQAERVLDEIEENVRADRSRLIRVADKLVDIVDDPNSDTGATIQVADQLAHLSDALTKSGYQLVEVAKVRLKRDLVKRRPDGKMDPEEAEELFDEIGHNPIEN